MSETEYNTGKLIPLILEGTTDEERAEAACNMFGYKMEPYYESWVECLSEEGHFKLYIHKGVVYKIENECDGDDKDIYEASENKDGTINYVTKFYNGGCSFDEALGYAMKKMEKNKGSGPKCLI